MRAAIAGVAGLVVGTVVGAAFLGDLGERPCHEVEAAMAPHRDVLTNTFGRGEEAVAAYEAANGIVEEHPGCFDPAFAEFLRRGLEDARERAGDPVPTVQPTVEATAEDTPAP